MVIRSVLPNPPHLPSRTKSYRTFNNLLLLPLVPIGTSLHLSLSILAPPSPLRPSSRLHPHSMLKAQPLKVQNPFCVCVRISVHLGRPLV